MCCYFGLENILFGKKVVDSELLTHRQLKELEVKILITKELFLY